MAVKRRPGQLYHDVPLSEYTTWRVGGCAAKFYQPKDTEDLVRFVQSLEPDEPVFWLGLGSNLLISDEGFAGTVIYTLGALNELTVLDEQRVYAGAGVSSAAFARFCARNHLTNSEFMAGIPGSIGGALFMNAGCWGGQTWEIVESVKTIHRSGEITVRHPDEYQVSYREVNGPSNEWFLGATFSLVHGEKENALLQIKELIGKRAAAQPTGEYNCGSVFRNPENGYAAQMIEQAGLKGHCIGGAKVSEKHANFIINTGNATARDIEQLIEEIEQVISKKFDVQLQREVCKLGIDGIIP